jgi:hypothetical protein
MDSLDEAGITYLTASSVSQWREAPALWVLRYLFGIKDFRSAAFARTLALRDGLKAAVNQLEIGKAEDLALGVYFAHLERMGIDPSSPEARNEHDSMLPMLDMSVKEFRARGLMVRPWACGIATSHWVEDIDVPLLSIADFVYESVQVKVCFTHRFPSKIRPKDLMGMAIDSLVRQQRVACSTSQPRR